MDATRISLLLLLPCFACFLDGEETVVKTVGKEPDSTPICTNETSNIIMMIACKIRTDRSSSEECSLLYRDGGDFVHECDSRFSLKKWNDTVFLHLTSLTAADSGNYTCECAKSHGTNILHLSITVEEDVWSGFTLPSALTAAVLVMILLVGILAFLQRKFYHREQPESCSHHSNEDFAEIEPYSIYTQKENGFYSTAFLQIYENDSDNENMPT
ncbi:uncharacterized protein LOC119792324 [Cyprinodon tularosa]|uniref:uncharacterized protein LOC119792324 n=1 Tax=Cyprinodon tularosa TaxID=77115 RepID=UPI0018E23552|nr:uncharacterized protein LOC119792324 [Cyprinodon tularosa]